MPERVLLLAKRDPERSKCGGYEFAADCGLQQFIVELDERVTSGLSNRQAQILLRELRPKIELAAQLRREDGEAHPESSRPGELLFRITLSPEDLR